MGVNFQINGKLLKTVVKAIENINEECIWTFDASGLMIRMSDVYRHKMIEIFIDRLDFLAYNCEGAWDIGIVIDRVKDVSKTLSSNDVLEFNYEGGDGGINLSANGLERGVKLIDINMVGVVPHLNLNFDYGYVIDAKTLKSFLKASSKANDFEVVLTPKNLLVRSETDEGVASANWGLPLNENSSHSTYSISATSKATSTMLGDVFIEGSDGGVLQLNWELGEYSKLKAMIAPRV